MRKSRFKCSMMLFFFSLLRKHWRWYRSIVIVLIVRKRLVFHKFWLIHILHWILHHIVHVIRRYLPQWGMIHGHHSLKTLHPFRLIGISHLTFHSNTIHNLRDIITAELIHFFLESLDLIGAHVGELSHVYIHCHWRESR